MASYYVWSGATGSANGSNWANAFTTLTTALATETTGDTLYVAHDHSESTAGTVALGTNGSNSNPTKIICVDRAGSVPPVSADRRTTAQVTATGNNNITFGGYSYWDGVIFNAGNSTGIAVIQIPTTLSGLWLRFDNCSFRLGSTGSSRIEIGSSGAGGNFVEWNNCTASFSAVAQNITLNAGILRWLNTPSALIGAQVPTTLFVPTTAHGGMVECRGVDLSAAGSGKTICGQSPTSTAVKYAFIDCTINASATKAAAVNGAGTAEVDFVRCGASGINYTIFHAAHEGGTLVEETTIVRSGGATDGTTPLAWKIVTTSACAFSQPFECPAIAIWNDTSGSAKTATVEGIASALPTDQEVWLECQYLGSASTPQGSFVSDAKADLLAAAANQTSSSATWGGSTAAFKLAVTFTPQQKGWIYAYVKIGKASSTFYVDPLVTLT